MPQITLEAKYRKNTGLVMSPEELMILYFYGFSDIRSQDGTEFSDETVRFYIEAAQREVEKFLGIKFAPTFLTESQDYYRDDYLYNFPFCKVSFPVNKAYSFIGMLNTVEQIVYPEEWLSVRRSTDGTVWRHINIVPNGSVVSGNGEIIYAGVSSYYGVRSFQMVPDYWNTQYSTGFSLNDFPYELVNVVGMFASIPVLAIYGDLILGAGIASQSLSIDALSQSISSTSSATNSGLGSRIVEYRKTIKETLDRVRKNYRGIGFTVC